jgi:hypothetical protein
MENPVTMNVGAVIFEDSTRLHLIYDDTANAALRPLFATEKAARDWLQAGMPKISEPKNADVSEENVALVMDIALEKEGALGLYGKFASRASKKTMWLTGPQSFMEMIYQNGATACREF